MCRSAVYSAPLFFNSVICIGSKSIAGLGSWAGQLESDLVRNPKNSFLISTLMFVRKYMVKDHTQKNNNKWNFKVIIQ